jgi:carbamoyl-phosphate synthase small subunit
VGANLEDQESVRPYIEALIVREFSQISSNWRSSESTQLYLNRHKIPVIWDIDTRALVRHIRNVGALRGIVSTDGTPGDQLVFEAKQLPSMAGQELASRVTCPKPYGWDKGSVEVAISPWSEPSGESDAKPESYRHRVLAFDYGIKQNILRLLVDHNCDVWVVPAQTSAQEVLDLKPDGVFLSNGPGDPEGVPYLIDSVRGLLGRVPIFGICLGHQILGLAAGGRTYKLPFGHHGANHPVRDLATGRVEITSQNHGFAVDPASLAGRGWEPSHVNLNDATCEGLRHTELPVFCVQYHPEASPGPHDANYLFHRFTDLMASRS